MTAKTAAKTRTKPKTYDLYLESGPKRMKTMVHVPELLGCVAVGPTSDGAVATTPEAIHAYLRFLRRIGERVNPEAPFELRVAEHVAEAGKWLGNGSPWVTYGSDVEPVSAKEIETCVARFRAMRETLASWAAARTAKQLDAAHGGGGRTARAILLHIIGGSGAYASPVVGGVKGFSALQGAATRGEVALPEALRREVDMIADVLRAVPAELRSKVIERPDGTRTLRKAVRRLLEHDWEHLSELSRRRAGPAL
jgi:predicted RNase H-like HicB family nuclease